MINLFYGTMVEILAFTSDDLHKQLSELLYNYRV